jgi:putative copper export protein
VIELLAPPLTRWLLFVGVLLLGGVASWRTVIAPGAAARFGEEGPARLGQLEPRVAAIGAGASLILLAVWGLRLYIQLLGFRDPFVPVSEDLAFLVFETTWGMVWMVQGGLLGLLALGFVLATHGGADMIPARVEWGSPEPPPRLPWRWRLLNLGILGVVATVALSSHAMSVPAVVPLAVALDGAHTLAAGAWIGSLALILTLTRPGNPHQHGDRSALLASQLRAFSPVAMVSVGVLVFAGFILATQHVMIWRNLWVSPYGRVLGLKVAVAAVVMLLGALNWQRGLPGLDTPSGSADTRRRAWFEVGCAGLVLAVTAWLTGMSMPEGLH